MPTAVITAASRSTLQARSTAPNHCRTHFLLPGCVVSWTRLWKTGTGSDVFSVEKGNWPAELRLALEELGRLIQGKPELAIPGETLARMLRSAFGTRGSVDPCLDPGEPQTDFLISRIREGWREGVPAVRVIAPALDQARLASRAKAVAESSEAESDRGANLLRMDHETPRSHG